MLKKLLFILIILKPLMAQDFYSSTIIDTTKKSNFESKSIEYKIDLTKTTNRYKTFKNLILNFYQGVTDYPQAYVEEYNSSLKMYYTIDNKKILIWSIDNTFHDIEITKDFIVTLEYSGGGGPIIRTAYNIFTGIKVFTATSSISVYTYNDFEYYIGFQEDQIYNVSYIKGKNFYYGKLIFSTPNNVLQLIKLTEIITNEPRFYSPYVQLEGNIINITKWQGKDSIQLRIEKNRINIKPIFNNTTINIENVHVSYSDDYLTGDIFTKINSITDKKILRILRNELFAHHGHSFRSEDLRKYFNDKKWYNEIKYKMVRIEEFTNKEKQVYQEILNREKQLN